MSTSSSSSLSLFDELKSLPFGLEDAISSELQMNNDLLPEHIRLSPEEYTAWSRLTPLVGNDVRSFPNGLLFRLIRFSAFAQLNGTAKEPILVHELIRRICLGPNDASKSMLAELNTLSGSEALDWFHIDSIATGTKLVSWNPKLPHPYVDMLQLYFPLRNVDLACQNGEFWIRLGYIPFIDCNSVYNSICELAAKYGHLHVLKWARSPGNECPWDELTCAFAAQNGHLDVLKWAIANNCPRDESCERYAEYNGHLDVVNWIRENN